MINCIDLDNFALTGNVSRYNEDSLTAQQLLIKSARHTKDAVELLKSLDEGIKNMFSMLELSYNSGLEELVLSENTHIMYNGARRIARYYFLFNENSKSLIELAGDINKVINDGLTAIPNIISQLSNVEGVEIEDKLEELQAQLDNCYLDIYDDCSFTTLELAGSTAKNVNEFITLVNMLETIAITINSSSLTFSYTEDGEMLITSVANNDDEILEI